MSVVNVTDENFDSEVLKEDQKAVLVDFWAEWCGPCKMLAPVVEGISQKFEASLKVCKLDTDPSPNTAASHEITGIPCCILFKNGKEAARIVGYRSESAFEEELAKHL